MNGIMKGINSEEILTCLILVAIGYFIAKMFSRCSGNGFSVGGKTITCSEANDGGWLGDRSEGECNFTGTYNNINRSDGWEGVPCCMEGMDKDNDGNDTDRGTGACGYLENGPRGTYCLQDTGFFGSSDLDNNKDCIYHWSDDMIECK